MSRNCPPLDSAARRGTCTSRPNHRRQTTAGNDFPWVQDVTLPIRGHSDRAPNKRVIGWIAVLASANQGLAIRQNVVDAAIDPGTQHGLDEIHRSSSCATIVIASHDDYIMRVPVRVDAICPVGAKSVAALAQWAMRVDEEQRR
eukprot:CAMPEP_0198611886 /NCGR_PEP_ID=MMETSP1462-20131121/157620_1 /TAXON_ID=1333877 /ORGANISM="Brandtodinium nutriculum, Strain RCC3387" /LENGTH=143 /DNA_ID=CAMNT_0044343691 /DNA_START=1074 /DNA_END=1502 /DNA_ORIENTATION=+